MAPEVDFVRLAELTAGYSGDDITNVCRDAAMNGMRRRIAGKKPEEIRELMSLMQQETLHDPVCMPDFLQVRNFQFCTLKTIS